MRYLVANWKAYKTNEQAITWMDSFTSLLSTNETVQQNLNNDGLAIIIAPSYLVLDEIKDKLKSVSNNKNIYLAAQDVSSVERENVTGDVTVEQLKGLVEFIIVGHSEHRALHNETEKEIQEKVELVHDNGLKSILCISKAEQFLAQADLIAYEPIEAIGSGKNASNEEILQFRHLLPQNFQKPFLYGGSVSLADVDEYLQVEDISGFLVATHSLDPQEFIQIAERL